MATVDSFTFSGGPGSFTLASNWSLGTVPNSSDDAIVGLANGDAIINGTDPTVAGIGTNISDAVRIETAGILTLLDGTDSHENFGSIVLTENSELIIDSGTFDNPGTVLLFGIDDLGAAGFLTIGGSVILDGGGNIEMAVGGGVTANLISGSGGSSLSLINEDNTISGDGTVGNSMLITNGADGLFETNNSTSGAGGHMQIVGTTVGGNFVNDGTMRIDPTGEFIFGDGTHTGSINNESQIIFDPDLQTATLAITGNMTIQAVFGTTGRIEMEGPGYSGNQIVSDGAPATLTLSGQSVDGGGSIGDANLTLNLLNSTISADVANEPMILFTGTNTITNNVSTLAAFSGDLDIESAVNNLGTIEVDGGGIVDLFAAVTGSGAINVGDGTLDVHAAVSGNIAFTSGGGTIIVESGGSVPGVISGAAPTDAIDDRAVNFVSGVHAVWQQNGTTGTLSLVNNGSTLASFTLSGQYSSANFTAFSDGNGGTAIEVDNPSPPGGTTADMVMRDGGSGNYEIYDLGGNAILAAYGLGQVGLQWQVAGLGDFNGSDTSDMILREDSGTLAGSFEVYDISNNNITTSVAMGQVGTEWQVSGFGDFSSRGETDMLMRDSSNGAFEVYDISNNAITSATAMGQVGLEWSVAGVGDFSSNPNETDMLMRDSTNGAFEVYDISNNAITSAGPMGQVGLEWSVAGVGDFSGNANETDMLMRDSNTGAFEIYDIRNNTITSAAPMGAVGLEWQVAGFGPINGAGAVDMLMRDSNTGAFEVYDISNNQLTTAAAMGAVGLSWSVAGIAADPPSGAAAASSQLVQAMASVAGSGAPLDTGSPLGSAAMPSNASGVISIPGVQTNPA